MGKIVAIANQKGGVGKTTTAINLAASLAILEKRVLIIDADPQANASSGVGIAEEDVVHSIYDCLVGNCTAKEAILETSTPNLFIIASDINLVGAEMELINVKGREFVMSKVVETIRADFDYIFIDCLPSLGLVTLNALTAADSVLVPVQCEVFSLEGLSKIKSTISLVKQSLNPKLEIEGILLSMYDSRLRLANIVVNEIRQYAQDPLFETIVHRSSRIAEAPNMHVPVLLYDAMSKGAINFLNLAHEFLKRNNDVPQKTGVVEATV